MSRRRFTREFKIAAVERLQGGESASWLARELEVRRKLLYQWRDELEQYGPEAFPGPGRRSADSAPRARRGEEETSRIALLERKIGQQALEIDFLKKALQRVENLRRDRIVSGAGGSTK